MQAYLANNAQKWKQDDIENKNHEDALKELLKCTNPRQTCAKNIMIRDLCKIPFSPTAET